MAGTFYKSDSLSSIAENNLKSNANYIIQCMYSQNGVRKSKLWYGTEEELRKSILETENGYYLTENAVQVIIEQFPEFFDNKKINILHTDVSNNLDDVWEIVCREAV